MGRYTNLCTFTYIMRRRTGDWNPDSGQGHLLCFVIIIIIIIIFKFKLPSVVKIKRVKSYKNLKNIIIIIKSIS